MTLWELFRVLWVGYPAPPEMMDPAFPVFFQRIGGLSLTLVITVMSLGIGFPLGCLLALCRREAGEGGRRSFVGRLVSRGIRSAASGFVEVVRIADHVVGAAGIPSALPGRPMACAGNHTGGHGIFFLCRSLFRRGDTVRISRGSPGPDRLRSSARAQADADFHENRAASCLARDAAGFHQSRGYRLQGYFHPGSGRSR